MTTSVPVEGLAKWLEDRLDDVEVYIGELPVESTTARRILLRPSGGGPARGATRTDLVEIRIYAQSLQDSEELYEKMEELLLGATRLRAIITINSEGSPTVDVDVARRRHLRVMWCMILPRRTATPEATIDPLRQRRATFKPFRQRKTLSDTAKAPRLPGGEL